MKRVPQSFSNPRRMQGAVLFVALVFLVLITLLGLTAASTSVLQERMTGGMRNNQLGTMGSETAARGAEAWLWNLANTSAKFFCGYNGSGGCYSVQTTVPTSGTGTIFVENPKVRAFRTVPTWLPLGSSGGTAYAKTMTGLSGSAQTASLSKQPQYMIEYLGRVAPPGGGSPACVEFGSENRYACGGVGGIAQGLYSYRITARSTGGNDATVRVIETYFGTGIPSL